MQSNMIFKEHIDRLSTDVRLNNNHDMVCGIIFSRDFAFQISSFNTIREKTCEIIHLSYDEVSDLFRTVTERAEYNPSCLSYGLITW